MPRWPKEPILLGETGELLVQFDSKAKGKVGGQYQAKRITITANTNPGNNYIMIKGLVHAPEQADVLPERHDYFDIDAKTIMLWPNPSSEYVQMDLSEFAGKSVVVEDYNVSGQLQTSVLVDQLTADPVQVDVRDYDPGPYTFSISMEGHNRIAKIVVVH